jgi:signal transduction histidine kinase
VPERRLERMADGERWLAWLRLAGVVFAACDIAFLTADFPPGYLRVAWAVTAAFAAGSIALLVLANDARLQRRVPLGIVALTFDTLVLAAYGMVFSFEYGNETRWAVVLVVLEAALRFGLVGGIVLPLVLVPYFAFNEWWEVEHFGPQQFVVDRVVFPSVIMLFAGLVVGWLVRRLDEQARLAFVRAREAETLRDALGRRVDVLEAANRCARALGSSLELEEAFAAFLRELRGLLPFDRTGLVLLEQGEARVVAAAGRGAGEVFAPGSVRPAAGSILDEVVLQGRTVYRPDLQDARYPEERELLALGLRSRLVAPLLVGARAIGALSLVRREEDAFTEEDVELVSLLGRLAGTAVQNIRSYEAERQTVEELRRLSALRADFVSLVSHELRSPMAAVIGAARTLQERWRVLTAAQRESFLALIADETNRLAGLVGDVLDTSRIEAGTFSYRFGDVDLRRLVEDAVAVAAIAQDEVRVVPAVSGRLPPVRGDRERLRQVLGNLIDNAVKYSPEGGTVEVSAALDDGTVRISVSDAGPGISYDQQRLIFEKFGRADVAGGGSKPGTGLGLFIARSIAEAHGGSLEVSSRPEAGATFTLTLPAAH